MKELNNYLKAYRKQSGLSQKDISYLINKPSISTVSKFENDASVPSLETAICLKILFSAGIKKLLPKIYKDCEYQLMKRIDCLSETYQDSEQKKDQAKVTFLESVMERVVKNNNQ